MSKWQAQAPSNIAIIKYMGKTSVESNLPSNTSLSYTLDHLFTTVEIELLDNKSSQDFYEPLRLMNTDRQAYLTDSVTPAVVNHRVQMKTDDAVNLSPKGVEKFLNHFARMKKVLGVEGSFIVRSQNNFPADCGIASSASSFAALTEASYIVALDLSSERGKVEALTKEDLSNLSRQGSGSSCRSFFRPWSLWRYETAEKIDLPFEYLHHQVVLVSNAKKQVSSSEAHKRIATSLLNEGRKYRAETRLAEFLTAMNAQDWHKAFDLSWAEFWDMHALFESSQPGFGYMTGDSLKVLNLVRELWSQGDGPLVTMDAGPNVHLLYRPDQKSLAQQMSRNLNYQILSSPSLQS